MPFYLVSIDRTTHYRVKADDEDAAVDAALDGEGTEESGDTTGHHVELHENQEPGDGDEDGQRAHAADCAQRFVGAAECTCDVANAEPQR